MGTIVMSLMLLLASAPRAQEGLEDLGIPTRAPWLDSSEDPESGASKNKVPVPADRQAQSGPQTGFWERMEVDLDSLELWRMGQASTLRFARTRPLVFPLKPREGGGRFLFKEHQDVAVTTWVRGLDYWLALETLADRYGNFHRLPDGQHRRAAFALAYAAYMAQARFVREWSSLVSNDPALEELFDQEVPSLGAPPGSYTKIRERYSGNGFLGHTRALRSYYAHIGGVRALDKILGSEVRSWASRRTDDLEKVALPKRFKTLSPERSLEQLRGDFAPSFTIRSAAGPWTSDFEVRLSTRAPLLPPQPDWARATISTRTRYAVETLRHWFVEDPGDDPRPNVWMTQDQAREMRDYLLPGDILLVRRENFIGEVGLGGYWHQAGLYVGSGEERRKFFGDKAPSWRLEQAYEKAAGKEPVAKEKVREWGEKTGRFLEKWKHPWEAIKSTETAVAVQEGRPKEDRPLDRPLVLTAEPGGVALEDIVRFAAADSVAVLRPRMGRRMVGEGLLRAFALLARPYDFLFDVRSADAIGSAELVYRAYGYKGAEKEGLRFPLEEVTGRWSLSTNSLARKFDAEYGTSRQELDWVLFLDGSESRKKTVASTLEEFRRSWRRPRWFLEKEKTDEK